MAGTLVLGLSACATTPPKNISNLCSIFREKDDWYDYAKESSDRWGVPIANMMSVMHQESSFVADAKPPRTKILWVLPGPRKSSAYGYAQVKDETWYDYVKATGNSFADRDDFEDAVDFVGWYLNNGARCCGIAKNDVYRGYLAYHEGFGGYKRATYRNKKWLLGVANKVKSRAATYQRQLNSCQKELEDDGWWFF